jgi:hypothetical protein
MSTRKRVLQISIDIVVDAEYDGMALADDVVAELSKRNFAIIGGDFTGDMTKHYANDIGFIEV